MTDDRLNIAEVIAEDTFRKFRGGRITADAGGPFAVVDPKRLTIEVEAQACAQMVILHTKADKCAIDVVLGESAVLSVTEVFLRESYTEVAVTQAAGSRCEFVVVELCGANVSYRSDLDGRGAEWNINGVFVGTEFDRCAISLNTRHNVSDCKSESMIKGVVSGRAGGEFRGLVYVAPDAQRTDARQQSRNIELGSESHIVTLPQLEIYADDVQCSHGATVGHQNDDALFYMRQRGLSEKEAQRLQTEGFVKDIVMRCPIDAVRGAIEAEVDIKLGRL